MVTEKPGCPAALPTGGRLLTKRGERGGRGEPEGPRKRVRGRWENPGSAQHALGRKSQAPPTPLPRKRLGGVGWRGPRGCKDAKEKTPRLPSRVSRSPWASDLEQKGPPGWWEQQHDPGVGSALRAGGCRSRCLTQALPDSRTEVLGSRDQIQEEVRFPHTRPGPQQPAEPLGASGRPQTERARRLERRARGLQAVRIPSHLRTGRPGTTEVCRLADVGVRGPRSRCWWGWLLLRAAQEKPPVWPS